MGKEMIANISKLYKKDTKDILFIKVLFNALNTARIGSSTSVYWKESTRPDFEVHVAKTFMRKGFVLRSPFSFGKGTDHQQQKYGRLQAIADGVGL